MEIAAGKCREQAGEITHWQLSAYNNISIHIPVSLRCLLDTENIKQKLNVIQVTSAGSDRVEHVEGPQTLGQALANAH